jgi:hypothetical protein
VAFLSRLSCCLAALSVDLDFLQLLRNVMQASREQQPTCVTAKAAKEQHNQLVSSIFSV